MAITYRELYKRCRKEFANQNLKFDFKNNKDLQKANSRKEICKHFIEHSQNRAKGRAIKLLDLDKESEKNKANKFWAIIEGHYFKKNYKYDYLKLFDKFRNQILSDNLELSDGEDINFIELAKTCVCIRTYVYNFSSVKEFKEEHVFTDNAKSNLDIIKKVETNIYNMGTALISDFFKEQIYIKGRMHLIKDDIHMKRFLTTFFGDDDMDSCYMKLMKLYNEADMKTKKKVPVYKLDKMIYLLGKKYRSEEKMTKFAKQLRNDLGRD